MSQILKLTIWKTKSGFSEKRVCRQTDMRPAYGKDGASYDIFHMSKRPKVFQKFCNDVFSLFHLCKWRKLCVIFKCIRQSGNECRFWLVFVVSVCCGFCRVPNGIYVREINGLASWPFSSLRSLYLPGLAVQKLISGHCPAIPNLTLKMAHFHLISWSCVWRNVGAWNITSSSSMGKQTEQRPRGALVSWTKYDRRHCRTSTNVKWTTWMEYPNGAFWTPFAPLSDFLRRRFTQCFPIQSLWLSNWEKSAGEEMYLARPVSKCRRHC